MSLRASGLISSRIRSILFKKSEESFATSKVYVFFRIVQKSFCFAVKANSERNLTISKILSAFDSQLLE